MKNLFFTFFAVTALLSIPLSAKTPADIIGTIKDTPKGVAVTGLEGLTPIAFYTRTIETEGGVKTIRAQYKDASGKLLVSEFGQEQNGRFTKYIIEQHQLNKSGEINFNTDMILFEMKDGDKKPRGKSEQAKGVALAPLALIPHIEQNLDKLKEGATLSIRIAVWDRLETVGMDLQVVTEHPFAANSENLVVRMKPTNFIIARIVDPFFFEVSLGSKSVTKMRGRLPIKRMDGGKARDLDGILPIPQS